MASTLRRVLMVTLLGIVALAPANAQSRRRSTAPAKTTHDSFSANRIEHYVSDDVIAYVRPGLNITINSVTIGSDRKPVVDFNLSDEAGQPVDRLGKTTPGAVTLGFLIGWYNPATRQYTNYITRTATAAPPSPTPGATATQAANDSGGTYVDLETGHTRYTFKTALPAGFDVTKTHTLAIYANRNLQDIVGKTYLADTEFDFRPDGQPVTQTWDKINVATSCNNCHDPLSAHGTTGRTNPKTCALCHQPQSTDPDTGNTVDFKVMIHKIHDGDNLPSVKAGTPYQIIGFGQGVNDFSTVAFPQDIRNCQNCHEGTDPSAKPAQAMVYLTNPSRAACGSCHDDVNFDTGENHAGGVEKDDSNCATCHIPDSGQEFDASIKGAHTNPLKSKQLKGLNVTIVGVSNVATGKNPTIVFKLTNGDGSPIDGNTLSTFSPIQAGPTSSYTWYKRDNALTKATFDAAAGTTTYTFVDPIPADATGTWAFSVDVRRTVSLKRVDQKPDISVRESTINPLKYVSLTSAPAQPRRMAVTIQQCNTCHAGLSLHGGQRNTTEECVICHNPTNTTTVTAGGPNEGISFQRLIHRIHTGEELTQPFTIGSTSFNDVRFPGDRRDCAKCHTATGYKLPLPSGIDPVIAPRDYFSPQGPATAACLGCHDTQDTAAHAYLNAVTFPGATVSTEACTTWHGTGKEFDVAKVHAR